jgi:gliding motility-associated-like protein
MIQVMDKFEKLIKDAIQGHETAYSADAWKSLNKKLGPSKNLVTKLIVGTAAIIASIFIAYDYSQVDLVNNDETLIHTPSLKNKKNTAKIATEINTKKIFEDVNNLNTVSSTYIENTAKATEKHTNKNMETITDLVMAKDDKSDSNSSEDVSLQPSSNREVSEVSMPLADLKTSTTNEKLDSKFLIDEHVKCQSEPFQFSALKAGQNAVYEWNLGDGTIMEGNSINHQYDLPGTYSIQLSLKDLESNRTIHQSLPIDINVLSEPRTSFVVEHTRGIIPSTSFKNETSEIVSTEWEIVGLHASNRAEMNYSFRHKGSYAINLTTTKSNGCSSTSTKIVEIEKDYNLLAPTAFSPNEDNLNDFFIPKALPVLNLPFTMTIYDRQGKMVYQTSDANQPWNGLCTKDQVPAPDGVYIWVVQLTTESGEIELYQDQVTIAK